LKRFKLLKAAPREAFRGLYRDQTQLSEGLEIRQLVAPINAALGADDLKVAAGCNRHQIGALASEHRKWRAAGNAGQAVVGPVWHAANRAGYNLKYSILRTPPAKQ